MRVVFIFTLVTFIFFVGSSRAGLNSTQANAVKEFFKKLLQVDDFAVEYGAKPSAERKRMHKHMIELYQHYKDRNVQRNAIIRSIEPIKKFPEILKNILIFNMSSVKPTEKILTSHLHVFRRRISDRMSEDSISWTPLPPCKIRLFQVHINPDTEQELEAMYLKNLEEWNPVISRKKRHSKGVKKKPHVAIMKDMLAEFKKEGTDGVKLKSLDVIPVPQLSKGGWYSAEISMALRELLNTMTGKFEALLGVRFEGPRGKSIIPERFLKGPKDNTSSSFIVISSEDVPLVVPEINTNKIDFSTENAKVISDLLNEENTEKRIEFTKLKQKNIDSDIKSGDSDEEIKNDISNDEYESAGKTMPILKKNRHNHQTVNALKISYDPATDTIIQKKISGRPNFVEKSVKHERISEIKSEPKFIIELSSDEEGIDWNKIRKKRFLDDNNIPEGWIKPSNHPTEFKQIHNSKIENVHKLNNNMKERPDEDDLGDSIYFEPDVYIHEKLVPDKYRPHDDTEIETISEVNRDFLSNEQANDDIVESETLNPQHVKYYRKNTWGDQTNHKNQENNMLVKSGNPVRVKYRHRKRFLEDNQNSDNDNNNIRNGTLSKHTQHKNSLSRQRNGERNIKYPSQKEPVTNNRRHRSRNKVYEYTIANSHGSKETLDKLEDDDFILTIKTISSTPSSSFKQLNEENSVNDSQKWSEDEILKRIKQYSYISDSLAAKINADRRKKYGMRTNGKHDLDIEKDRDVSRGEETRDKKRISHNFPDDHGDVNSMLNKDVASVKDTNDRLYRTNKNLGSGGTTFQYVKTVDGSYTEIPPEVRRSRAPKKLHLARKLAQAPNLITDWKLWDNNDWETGAVNLGDPCRKKHFQVSFAELGWGDWIIAPDNFSTNYCAGHCQLSHLVHKKCDLDSTNHAILQSLIHAINRVSGVPEPCCVPAKMSSKTVLYQDPNGNVMLRNYPNMVVNSCECR